MPKRSTLLTSVAWILLGVGIVTAGPLNWFYSNATGTHFDAAQFRQPISILGMMMVVAAFVCGVVARKEQEK